MISYYNLKKNEKILHYLIVYISLIFLISLHNLFHSLVIDVFSIVIFYYLYFLISPESSLETIKFIFTIISISIFIFLLILFFFGWLIQYPIPYIGIISDNKMLVFVTLTYVILTYKIVRSNFKIFQYQRMPNIIIYQKPGDQFTFTIKNVSEFPASDILINIEILYPIPKTIFKIIRMWLVRIFEVYISDYKISNKPNPKYYFLWKSEKLESNDQMELTIRGELKNIIPLQVHKNDDREYEIYYSNEEIFFDVIIKCEYASLDNIHLKNPIFNLFKYKSNHQGINLLVKSGDLIKIK